MSLKEWYETIYPYGHLSVKNKFKGKHSDRLINRWRLPHGCKDTLITCYPYSEELDKDKDYYLYAKYLILDFDYKGNREVAYNEVKHIKTEFEKSGIESMIIDSTGKGYHLYVNINTKFNYFDDYEYDKKLYVEFIEELLQEHNINIYSLQSYDKKAEGLGRRMKCIGTTHPRTNSILQIAEGNIDNVTGKRGKFIITQVLNRAYQTIQDEKRKDEKADEIDQYLREKHKAEFKNYECDIEIDQIYPAENSNGTLCCPYHNDSNPSAYISHANGKAYLHCSTCGKTWFTATNKDGTHIYEKNFHESGSIIIETIREAKDVKT